MARTSKKAAPRKARAKNQEGGTLIDPERVAGYKVTKIKTEDGTTRRAVDSDDATARKLRGKTMDELKAIAREAGFLEDFNRWAKTLNPGMVRMNLGNKMRAATRTPKKAAASKPKQAPKKAA